MQICHFNTLLGAHQVENVILFKLLKFIVFIFGLFQSPLLIKYVLHVIFICVASCKIGQQPISSNKVLFYFQIFESCFCFPFLVCKILNFFSNFCLCCVIMLFGKRFYGLRFCSSLY
jgi:hypothetical protein